MGKKRHTQDKLWISYNELASDWGSKKTNHSGQELEINLPFNYCNLNLCPCTDPYCSPDGLVFEFKTILVYVKKHNRNPITGDKLAVTDLIKLNFFKDE